MPEVPDPGFDSRPHGLSSVVPPEIVVAVEIDQAFEQGGVAAELFASSDFGHVAGVAEKPHARFDTV